MFAQIGLCCAVYSERALPGVELIGEAFRGQFAGVSAMTDPGVIKQFVAFHVNDEQPALSRRLAVINDGQDGFLLAAYALIADKGFLKGLSVEFTGKPKLLVDMALTTGGAIPAPANAHQQQ